jgi:hypothetical protein
LREGGRHTEAIDISPKGNQRLILHEPRVAESEEELR